MLDDLRGQSVAAAELVRNFAHWREVGAREPVMITHHGRETHIFMGLDSFRTMAAKEMAAPPVDRLRELADHMHQGLILCNVSLEIEYINGVALSMSKKWDRRLEGQSLWSALPEFADALTETHIRHSLTSGEASAADIPSPFRNDSWLHFETVPFGDGIAILLRDITVDMQLYRLADVKAAILKAMSVHKGVGYLRVSMRGFIETADATFCTMVGLPEDRLSSVCVTDLVELSSRRLFREQLEETLRGAGDQRITTRLLTNDGSILEVDAAIAQLNGTYCVEGAVIVMTPTPK